MEKINRTLLEARRPLSTGGYMVKNQRTGCVGTTSRKIAGSPPELTVTHAMGCKCLDVRMSALCRHANYMVKLGRIRRARKYDLVLALKLRSCPALPGDLRLKVRRQKRKAADDDGDNDCSDGEDNLRVIEYRGAQTLTERWDSPETYHRRRIWLDW